MKITQVNNLNNEVYHNSETYREYWSSSNLKMYLETPREAYYQKYLAEKKESSAMDFGNALHDFLASKHVKGQPFDYNIFEPPVNPSTGKYYSKESTKYKQALEYINNPISADDMELIQDLWQMIKSSEYAWYFEQEILGKGTAEPSYFINDGIHLYKTRHDVNNNKIFDYKTITKKTGFKYNWNKEYLRRRIKDLGYDISAAKYQYFEHKRTGIWKPFIIVWIMKDPPFDILVHDISEYCFEPFGNNEVIVSSGANVFLKLKDQHEACQMANNWPGLANQFDSYNGLRMAKIPPRYDRGFDEFEIEIDD